MAGAKRKTESVPIFSRNRVDTRKAPAYISATDDDAADADADEPVPPMFRVRQSPDPVSG
jgi:hypothetical protein